jgi:hypothetical protein
VSFHWSFGKKIPIVKLIFIPSFTHSFLPSFLPFFLPSL